MFVKNRYLLIIILLLLLIFQTNKSKLVLNILSFALIFSIIFSISELFLFSIIFTSIIWFILHKIKKNYSYSVTENFDNVDGLEKNDDKKTDDKDKRVNYLKQVIKKLEGGIALTKDDLYEKNDIKDYDFKNSKVTEKEKKELKNKKIDDYKPHEAQKETFELISTVKQLKDTVQTLAPLLKQGKSILSSLEVLKV